MFKKNTKEFFGVAQGPRTKKTKQLNIEGSYDSDGKFNGYNIYSIDENDTKKFYPYITEYWTRVFFVPVEIGTYNDLINFNVPLIQDKDKMPLEISLRYYDSVDKKFIYLQNMPYGEDSLISYTVDPNKERSHLFTGYIKYEDIALTNDSIYEYHNY